MLTIIFGWAGVQWFYLGKTTLGVFHLVFFWTGIPALLSIFYAIWFICMSDSKFNELYNMRPIPRSDWG